jgi:5-methylcytosine-specific restriction endonuclease McrA
MTVKQACLCGVWGCQRHAPTWGWGSKPKWRDAVYVSPQYKTNRELAIQREPLCHWRLPGCTLKSTTADHLLAVSRGGSNGLDNLVGSCRHCNEARGRDLGNETKRRRR